MAVYSSLLSTIPIPQQQWQTKTNTPPVASVKVGEVTNLSQDHFGINYETPVDYSKSFFGRYFQNLRNKMVERRIKKLESIPPEQRTAVQQAEIDANKKERESLKPNIKTF